MRRGFFSCARRGGLLGCVDGGDLLANDLDHVVGVGAGVTEEPVRFDRPGGQDVANSNDGSAEEFCYLCCCDEIHRHY